MLRNLPRWPVLLVLVAFALSHAGLAEARGNHLDGRAAPDMTFDDGFGGISARTRLSHFRGRPVLVFFWLRDCPICHRALPEIQDMHDKFGPFGLQVLTVVHGTTGGQNVTLQSVAGVMRRKGWDFPVAFDRDGSEAEKYGIGHRPVSYVVGTDGRVVSSNSHARSVILRQLARYRLERVGRMPESMQAVRTEVWNGRMGTALETAERMAQAEDAPEEVVEAAKRVHDLAKETLDGRVELAETLLRKRGREAAESQYRATVEAFRGTSLEDEAKRHLDAFLSSRG